MDLQGKTVSTTKEVEVIQVIRTSLLCRGNGTEESPIRRVTQFYSLDGVLLAENDPHDKYGQRAHNSAALKLSIMYEAIKDLARTTRSRVEKPPVRYKEFVEGIVARLEGILDVAADRVGR